MLAPFYKRLKYVVSIYTGNGDNHEYNYLSKTAIYKLLANSTIDLQQTA